MRTLKFRLFTIILASFSSLQASPQQVAKSAIISGSVQVAWARQIAIGNKSAPLDSAGIFRHRVWLKKADYIVLSHEEKRIKIFLQPGDSLHIDWSATTLHISGT